MLVNRICKKHSDARYEKLQSRSSINSEKAYYLFQYSLQAFLIFFPMCPVYLLFLKPLPPTPLFYLGALLTLYGIYGETKADIDLEKFKKMKSEGLLKEKNLCDFGDWKYSRHPNIFFEVVVWSGVALMAFHPSRTWYNLFPFLGPLSLFFIVRCLTLPLTESCMRKKRPNWKQILRETNLLFPYWVQSKPSD